MLTPEITLNLIRQRRYGAKTMERRVKQCCTANPECPYQIKCNALYDNFLDALDALNEVKTKSNINIPARKEIYRQLRGLGLGSVEARANLSVKRVRELATAPP